MALTPPAPGRPTLRAVATAALAALCLQAAAQSAAFDIPAQPLAEALRQFAAQAGVQLVFRPELGEGRSSRPVQGTMDAEAALRELLQGSGLELRRDGATWSVAPAAASGATLPEVRVRGQHDAETATGPVHGLAARRSATATKTDTPLIETPQSITVVTAEQIRLLRSATLEQALDYSAGVEAVSGYSGSYDAVYSRGFWIDAGSSQYADGLRVSSSAWASGKVEPYGLERVELVKGAASVLYGMAAPGGVLATVSKRPTSEPVREVVLELGSDRHRQIGLDVGGAVSPDGDWDWRFTALLRRAETPTDPLRNDGLYLAPALRWRPSAATSLTLLMQHQKRRIGYRFSLPVDGTLVPGPDGGRIADFRFVGEPGFDRQDVTQTSLTALFEQAYSTDAQWRASLRLFDSNVDVRFTGAYTPVEGDPRRWNRRAFDETENVRGLALDTHWQQRWRGAGAEHTLLAGLDHVRYQYDSDFYARPLDPLDLYAPVYGAVPGPAAPLFLTRGDNRQTGIYLQNQSKWQERWVALAGLRHDWNRDGSGAPDEAMGIEDSNALTGRLGLVYLMRNGWAPFIGYSQSFQPQGGRDARGERFDPTEGEQVELGLRWQPEERNLLFSASLFDLRKTNVLTTDPDDPAFSVQTGEQRSRGLELELRGEATRHLELIGAYTYTDLRTTRSNRPEEVNRREARQPYHQASLWAGYRLAGWGLQDWTVGAGLRYRGRTLDRSRWDQTVRTVPDSTVADLMLAWQHEGWRLALNARNAFDKRTWTCGGGYCLNGDPRTVTASASYRW